VKRAALVGGLAVLAAVPLWIGSSYYINIATQILFYAIFALAVNILAGYAGLVSLGHAGLFGIAAYTGAKLMTAGHGHTVIATGAVVMTVVAAAVFAVLALRGTGLGFVMITVALGQIVWGVAYRWISLTNGDNGITISGRPAPLGLVLASPRAFYWATFVVFVLALGSMAIFVASPFGASVRGTRDQPRRMNALGYHVWMIRFLAFLLSGFWTGVAGLLYLYYHQFVSPHAVALAASAEALLMVISGGTATLLGPITGAVLVVVMKNVASAYIERWNFVLGAIFVAIVVFMPEGLVPGSVRMWRWATAVWRGGRTRARLA
jgi:branched-chain amino acid transport system permease protein